MISQFDPHLEMLPAQQQAVWRALRALQEIGFVLYGGTAVALRLGHRQSEGFDFFSSRPLDFASIRNRVPLLDEGRVIQSEPRTYSVLFEAGTRQPVKISLFAGLTIPQLEYPSLTSDGVAFVASLTDLLGMKLAVLTQRVEAKDYIDILAIVRDGRISLSRGLAAARALYGLQFQPAESLKALTYFENPEIACAISQDERAALIESATRVTSIENISPASPSIRLPVA